MAPGLASWSPYILTPSLCPLESRPFLVFPAPFLCAIWMVRRRAGAGTPTAAPPKESAARSPRRKEGRQEAPRDRPWKAPAIANAMDVISFALPRAEKRRFKVAGDEVRPGQAAR
jgi:hypothetical protein